MAATGLKQPSKRLLGLELNVFYLVRKKLAAVAVAATGLFQPSKRLLGLELNIFLFSEEKSCCHCYGCYRVHPTLQMTFGFGIGFFFISWGKHLLPLLYMLQVSTNPPKDFWVWN